VEGEYINFYKEEILIIIMTNKTIDYRIETTTVEIGGVNESGEKRTVTMGKYQNPDTGEYLCVKNL